jgi:hypothetical protein
LYHDFFAYLKRFLANIFLPKMLDLLVQLFEHEISEPFFEVKFDETLFFYKNELFDKSNEFLQEILTQIYQKYGVKEEQIEEEFNEPIVNEFSDFEDLDFVEVVDEKTAFLFFDLPQTASFIQIQRAYKKMAKIYHPDLIKTTSDNKKMEQINFAYSILKTKFLKK